MAVRSAVALGLHREETLVIFSEGDQILRKNLWRSLFVLDGFLSASLGRPTAISEDDCSGDSFRTDNKHNAADPLFIPANKSHASSISLEASVRSSQVIGIILRKVYSKRKISTKLAQEIADKCKAWPKELDASLHWRQMVTASAPNSSHGIAILHVNLLYCHTIILLTRPFFLFLLNKVQQERAHDEQRPQRVGSRMEKFSEACVMASCHSIILVQNALDGGYLSHRDPFVMYDRRDPQLIVPSADKTLDTFSSLHP
jgi:Fungal specific transcription factor domain